MNEVLEVKHLFKTYPGFVLRDITFRLESGRIMGLFGPEGAGKTTMLKALIGLVHPEGGEIRFFGLDPLENARTVVQRVGYAGGAHYFPRKKISEIMAVTRRFYDTWDEEEYQKHLALFELDPAKTPAQLAPAMRVKLHMAIAMSHRARLLILDGPTAGLDDAGRDELCDAFWALRKKGVSILFSTDIGSDLEKCADDITLIRNGQLLASEPLGDFIAFHKQMGFNGKLQDILTQYEK
ncbi:MAG: ABC transporter ATP-binding protein, partial [Oscillospiraceae bacterium]|nr:ABC transporter ATP-binding protein [Oscillospiraceae bacterium]